MAANDQLSSEVQNEYKVQIKTLIHQGNLLGEVGREWLQHSFLYCVVAEHKTKPCELILKYEAYHMAWELSNSPTPWGNIGLYVHTNHEGLLGTGKLGSGTP